MGSRYTSIIEYQEGIYPERGKITFMGAGDFLDMFLAFRILWVDGRHGGGKTSLAVMLAGWLLANNKVEKVVSNFPCCFSENIIKAPLTNCAIVLDEAWIYIDTRQAVQDYAAFVRKFEHYLILPSVWELHHKLSFFTCYRLFNGYTYGFPFWVYGWKLRRSSVKEKGKFIISNPHNIFGYYPTKFVPGEDGGIYEAISETARLSGYRGKRSLGYNEGRGNIKQAEVEGIEDLLESSNFQMAETVEDIEDAVRSFRIKKGRK